ncbi:transcriptional regulator with XRE-family HTH domain [Microbacterium phyllosphaerae]|uniref:Transcriptional regulator with XRE-family HTH domain n=1 Tax=Microbacterium phyllosphaerae TaxID=124798 RepID=A0ABS4WL55_9MICO|nr:helix-turn-helix transcriptional regulator [Microbacterium phyllosphaerae]MBP2376940.1 transcriptional regulator with XRE-family HTH domain [Microbacterium phyllosphaerae]
MADLVPFSRAPRPARPRPSEPEPLWRQMLGDQLRRRRHGRDETLTETAENAGVSPQYLSEVERGLKEPSSEMIAAIAGALDTSLIELTSAVADELRQVTAAPASAAVPASRGAFALAA